MMTDLTRPLPAQCLVIGDRFKADVAIGRAVGMTTTLTLIGATDCRALAEATVQPDHVIDHSTD